MANTIEVEILVQVKEAQEALKKLQKQVDTMASNSGKGIKKLDIAIGAFAANLATIGFQKVVAGAKDLFNFLVTDGVKAAQEQEDAINRLNIALQSTGIYSEQTSKDLQSFASAMQETTKYSADLVLENMALLQTLTDLSKEGLKDATKASLDMAAALQIDLRTATMAVAKAAEGNVDALKKYGVEVKKGTDDAETFANALTALNAKFGGAASGTINTFSGSMAQLKNTINDLQAEFGNLIIKNPAVIAAIQAANKIFQDLKKYVTEAGGEFESFITFIAQQAPVVLQGLVDAFKSLIKGATDIKEAFEGAKTSWEDFSGVSTAEDFNAANHAIDTVNEKLKALKEALTAAENADPFTSKIVSWFTDVGSTDDLKKQIAEQETALVAAQANLQGIMEQGRAEEIAAVVTQGETKKQIITEQTDAEIAEETRKQEAIKAIQKTYVDASAEAKIAEAELALVAGEEAMALEQEYWTTRLAELELIKMDARIKEAEAEGLHREAMLLGLEKAKMQEAQIIAKADQKFFDTEKAKRDFEKKTTAQKFTSAAQGMDALVELQSVKSKEAFAVGKAAAIAQTLLSIPESAQKAYSSLAGIPIVGPALGAVAAAAAVISGIARLNQIKSTSPGFADGGIIGGSSYTGDNVGIRANSGEMVLNKRQQENLFNSIDSGGVGGTSVTIQGNVIADDDSQVIKLIDRINDAIQFGNAQLRTG